MQYYYLDGLDKKGPYTKEELKSRSVGLETLVFFEGMDGWKPAKDIPELNQFLFDNTNASAGESTGSNLLHPIPQPDNSKNADIVQSSDPGKIKIPSILFLVLSYGLCIGLSYLVVSKRRQDDLTALNKRIDAIFKMKDAITDYKFDGSQGQLYEVYQTSMFGIGDNDIVRTSKRTLAVKPASGGYDQDKYAAYNESQQKQWGQFKDLVHYYESAPFTGFEVIRLEREGQSYSITKSWSGDMAYKVPESRHYEGYSSAFFTSPGYDIPTHRPPVSTCYEEAAKYLTEEREDKSYEAGSYSRISAFTDLETSFYEISQRYPKYSRLINKIHVEMLDKTEGDVIDNAKITDATSAADANVFNPQWIVWYKSITNTYSIEEKKHVFNKLWLIYSVIGIAIATITFFGLKFRKRISIK